MANENTPTNTSGQGQNAVVPDEVKNKFNWGAFLLSWIWGIGNKTYLTFIYLLVLFIPFVGQIAALGLCIWFGIKGNEWAWQNKNFQSVKAFHEYQKKWVLGAILGYILMFVTSILFVVMLGVGLGLSGASSAFSALAESDELGKTATNLNTATILNKSAGKKCELSSEGLAACYGKEMYRVKKVSHNTIKFENNSQLLFQGNGICKNTGDCSATITLGSSTAIIPLYTDKQGFIIIKDEDIKKYVTSGISTADN